MHRYASILVHRSRPRHLSRIRSQHLLSVPTAFCHPTGDVNLTHISHICQSHAAGFAHTHTTSRTLYQSRPTLRGPASMHARTLRPISRLLAFSPPPPTQGLIPVWHTPLFPKAPLPHGPALAWKVYPSIQPATYLQPLFPLPRTGVLQGA